MNILSTLWGFVILIVLFVSPQMLLWGIGIGIYGVPLGVLGAVLAYMPGYRRWLVSRKGYLYISLLPGLSATQQDELRPARLLLLSLGCLVIPSLLWWLFLWSSGTFVGSDGLENAGIYAIVSLIGLALFIRWLNKGWKFNAEFSARTVDISEKSKKWSVLLQLLWPKHLMSRAFLYLTLTGFILLLLKLFGLYVTLIETILVCLPAYRFWLIRRPGYSYYLARLPGLRINAQRTIKPLKLVVATLLYLLIPSLLGIVINQVAEVFIPQNLQDYGILVFACLIAFGLLHLWLVLAWGTEARLLDIRVLGENTSNTTSSQQWPVIWKTSFLDISKRVLPYLKALRLNLFILLPLIFLLPYFLRSLVYFGVPLTLLGVLLAYIPAYRNWLTCQLGYRTRLGGLSGWDKLPGLTGLPRWLRKKPGLPGWRESPSSNRLACVTLLYLLLLLIVLSPFWLVFVAARPPTYSMSWATLQPYVSPALRPLGYIVDAVLMVFCWSLIFGWFIRGWKVLDRINAIVDAMVQMGKYTEARQLATQACDLSLRYRGKEHITYATSLKNMGMIYQAVGDYASAEDMLQRAVCIAGKAIGTDRPVYAEHLSALAELYHQEGRYNEALPYLREALNIMRHNFRTDLPAFAEGLGRLALWYHEMGNDAYTDELLEQTLKLMLGRAISPDVPLLTKIASLWIAKGNYQVARLLLEKVLNVKKVSYPIRASALDMMGLLAQREGNYVKARTYLEQALNTRHTNLGAHHPQTAASFNSLGLLAQREGNYAEARDYLEQALNIRRTSLGAQHPDVAKSLYNLANLCTAMGRVDEALDYRGQAEAITDHTIGQVFSVSSESQRRVYQGILQQNLHAFLTLIVEKACTSTAEYSARALDLVERRKAIGMEAVLLQRKALSVLGEQHPDLIEKLRELDAIRAEIARSTLAGPGKEGRRAHHDDLQRLSARQQAAEAALSARMPKGQMDFDFSNYLQRIDHRTVAEVLFPGTAFVEFIRYTHLDMNPASDTAALNGGSARYLAFVLLPERAEQVRMIDLGDADRIDQMVADFRTSITGIREGQNGAARHVRPVSQPPPAGTSARDGTHLREMIFDPLLPVLDSRRYLFLALDGDLTRLPFEVLPMGEELYLLDHYHVRYLSSGRDLLRFKEPASPSSPPLVIADPDYNLEDHSSGAQGRQVYRQQSRDLQHSGGEGRFPRLPKTQEEGMQIGKILNVQPRLNKEALKGYLKRYNSPYILHIASHGFFLPNQPVQAATRAFDIWDMVGLENIAGPTRQVRSGRFEQLAGQQIENPLLRAGLALAGANTWERRGALPPLAEDGILNAEEVCGLNMQGTELVVLSACETGLGDVDQRFGEGVFGLRRAFMLAGAKTLVMSLWHVPDEQTQQLMNNFYRFMLGPARLGRAEALRSAQLELKSHYPHPYYWGGFICQGDPGPLQLRTEE